MAQELLARQIDANPALPQLCSVTLLNGGLFPETHRPTLTQRMLLTPLRHVMHLLVQERGFSRALSEVFGPDTQPGDIELHDYWTVASHGDGTRALSRLIHYIEERRQHRQRWVGALIDTRTPLRLINGAEDPVSGAHMAARYRELVPNPDIVLLDRIGHYPQAEAPERTLGALLDFHARLH